MAKKKSAWIRHVMSVYRKNKSKGYSWAMRNAKKSYRKKGTTTRKKRRRR